MGKKETKKKEKRELYRVLQDNKEGLTTREIKKKLESCDIHRSERTISNWLREDVDAGDVKKEDGKYFFQDELSLAIKKNRYEPIEKMREKVAYSIGKNPTDPEFIKNFNKKIRELKINTEDYLDMVMEDEKARKKYGDEKSKKEKKLKR